MLRGPLSLLPLLVGCALNADLPPPQQAAPAAPAAAHGSPCAEPPMAERIPFRHRKNELIRTFGKPRFRGVDLIATEDDPVQTLGGKLAYNAADSDVTGEDVHVYACFPKGWKLLGLTRTDRDGRFALELAGAERLPVGMRDLYAHVPGDPRGARFLALVAPRGMAAIVSDVDGTLTESEDAILGTVVFGDDIGHQPHAPRALAAAAAAGQPIIYLTSRGDQLTEVTRRWLAIHGFPPGPLRLARAGITKPGPATVAFKAAALRALSVPIAAGIGNRASDVAAYARAGLPPAQILIHVGDPELVREVSPEVAAGRATGFRDYREVPALLARPAP
jgi:phosphoglycolate phosphatase-like HAD superfamily hydrolase